jgi:hypothetical protein
MPNQSIDRAANVRIERHKTDRRSCYFRSLD